MTKCFLDANILIYYKDETSDHYQKAVNLLTQLTKQGIKLCLSPLCLDEIIHTLNYIFKKDFEKLTKTLDDIFDLPLLEIVNPSNSFEENKKVIKLMKDYDLHPRDAYHLLTMQTNNIDGFATFDSDFKKVFAAKLLQKA